MSFITKVKLKYELQRMGINIVEGSYIFKSDINKVIAVATKITASLSEKDFIAAVVQVAKDAKLHTPKNSYWECNNFSTAVVLCAKELSLDAELLSVHMKFQKDINEVEKGDTENHTYFRLGSRYYDFTLSQFLGSNKAYAVRTSPYPKSKHNPTKADPDGYTFWYDKIKNKLTALGVKMVGSTISNLGSISATLTDWEELPGIREISMSDWEADPHKLFYSKSDIDRCKKLAAEIEHSKRIDPLIVVIPSDKDKDGVYVLEGGHRLGALHILKAKSFPALVVIDTEDRAVEAKASLKGLEAEAAKCETFEEFKKAFSVDIKHGLYWHVTADPDFKIDPSKGPSDMSSMSNGKPKLGKLMVTSHLENWTNYYGKDRPYAAEIDMSEVDPKDYQQVARGFGNEFWVENPAKAKVVKVYKVQQALRRDAQYRSKLPNSDKELRQIFDKVHPSLTQQALRINAQSSQKCH